MTDAFDYIERLYHRRFKRRMRVLALGNPGVVTGTESAHVMVKLDALKHSLRFHPIDVEPEQGGAGA